MTGMNRINRIQLVLHVQGAKSVLFDARFCAFLRPPVVC